MKRELMYLFLGTALYLLAGCPINTDDDGTPSSGNKGANNSNAIPFDTNALRAFPGAEGWGTDMITGGRGGKVVIVDNLNSSGPGSFYNALVEERGKRIIVFRVSGVIDGKYYLQEQHSDVTIAGQTSPGGITLISSQNGSTILSTYDPGFHNGIFRFLRFRGDDKNSDTVSIANSTEYIFDHCDFSGGTDECASFKSPVNATIQWCIINDPMGTNKASLIAGPRTKRMTMHHNMWANAAHRCAPAMHWGSASIVPENGNIDFRNNVLYNYLNRSMYVQFDYGHLDINVVKNYFKNGPKTERDVNPAGGKDPIYINPRVQKADANGTSTACITGNAWIYSETAPQVLDNSTYDWFQDNQNFPGKRPAMTSREIAMAPVATETALEAYDSVRAKVGAFPRDLTTTRTVEQVTNNTGSWKQPNEALLNNSHLPLPQDNDRDGMADIWEIANGLDPADPSDAAKDFDMTGYTNIEKYINDLAFIHLNQKTKYPTGGVESFYNPSYNPI